MKRCIKKSGEKQAKSISDEEVEKEKSENFVEKILIFLLKKKNRSCIIHLLSV